MDSDESIKHVLQEDMAHIIQLLTDGHEPLVICAAKLRNVLMIYKTTLPPDEYASMIQCIVAESDNVPDLKDYPGLINFENMGLH